MFFFLVHRLNLTDSWRLSGPRQFNGLQVQQYRETPPYKLSVAAVIFSFGSEAIPESTLPCPSKLSHSLDHHPSTLRTSIIIVQPRSDAEGVSEGSSSSQSLPDLDIGCDPVDRVTILASSVSASGRGHSEASR